MLSALLSDANSTIRDRHLIDIINKAMVCSSSYSTKPAILQWQPNLTYLKHTYLLSSSQTSMIVYYGPSAWFLHNDRKSNLFKYSWHTKSLFSNLQNSNLFRTKFNLIKSKTMLYRNSFNRKITYQFDQTNLFTTVKYKIILIYLTWIKQYYVIFT